MATPTARLSDLARTLLATTVARKGLNVDTAAEFAAMAELVGAKLVTIGDESRDAASFGENYTMFATDRGIKSHSMAVAAGLLAA